MIFSEKQLVYNKILIKFATVFRRVLTALRLFVKNQNPKEYY